MFRVKYFLKKKPSELKTTLELLGIQLFRPTEVSYIQEYVKVMEPLVNALNILQGQENVSMGYLLPTLNILKNKFEAMIVDSTIKCCKSLVLGISDAISKRLTH